MGWSIGYDSTWKRDIGYGVPATCDHPGCGAPINRGLGYVCGGRPYGGDGGCGLYFCCKHQRNGRQQCARCVNGAEPFDPTPDVPHWIRWKLTDESWQRWRDHNPAEVESLKTALAVGESR